MRVRLHISLVKINKKQRRAVLELPDGTTLIEALEKHVAENKIPLDLNYMPGVVALRNKSVIRYNDTLNDGDEVILLRRMVGG